MRPRFLVLPVVSILIVVACSRSEERVDSQVVLPPEDPVGIEAGEEYFPAQERPSETTATDREVGSVERSAQEQPPTPPVTPTRSQPASPEAAGRPTSSPVPTPQTSPSERAPAELPQSRPEPEIVPSPPRPTAPAQAEVQPATQPAPSAGPSPPPAPVYALIPEGTVLQVSLGERLSSERNTSGDRFKVLLEESLTSGAETVAPVGTVLTGRLPEVEGSGRVRGRARMSLELTELKLGGESYSLSTNRIAVEADGSEGRDAKVIGGGAGLGALIGAIAGGKRGAAIGAAIGGGAGTSAVLVTKGKEVEFEPEQRFSFRLERDVEVRLR